ncbi:MAG TPA: LPS export ABC transporter ATP-binding protein [bacterium]|nr:LPS export ABC transporter ATP-binding protein [bacterium]
MSTKILGTEGLFKSYRGRNVVQDVSVHVRTGEVVGLLGPNGAGKTTTFYMVVGLVKGEKGSVYLETREDTGKAKPAKPKSRSKDRPASSDLAPSGPAGPDSSRIDLTKLPMHERARLGVGYLAQEASAFRKLTVEENLRAILEMSALPQEEQDLRVAELLDEFGLHGVADQKAYTLSGGERRRTEVARALALKPDFILLDEPFVGIDPLAVGDLQGVIRQLKGRGIGVLITDHNVRETLSIIDRAYLLFQGQVLVSGTAKALASDPKARKLYLGEGFKM